jgi:hypothetical protein
MITVPHINRDIVLVLIPFHLIILVGIRQILRGCLVAAVEWDVNEADKKTIAEIQLQEIDPALPVLNLGTITNENLVKSAQESRDWGWLYFKNFC